jgi:Zn-finger nucleic acid-binding protein
LKINNQEVLEMLCPKCRVGLTIADRQGIEIDFCPNCRGVWLDRGELDKIIERAAGQYQPQAQMGYGTQPGYPPQPPMGYPSQPYPPQAGYQYDYDDDDDDQRRYQQGYPQPGHPHYRKKKGFLGDMFDFD